MKKLLWLLVVLAGLSGCAGRSEEALEEFAPGEAERLNVFTVLEESVYEPIVREFEARTGIWVTVETGSWEELARRIGEGNGDVLFGGSPHLFDARAELFSPWENWKGIPKELPDQAWAPFSGSPVVLIYNTKLVRLNPPQKWSCLVDPAWKGKIAFADPVAEGSFETVGILLHALSGEPVQAFVENLNGTLLPDSRDVVSAVAEGSYYIGVTLEETARQAIENGSDLAVVYPQEGTWCAIDGAAVIRDCPHPENAEAFVHFLLGEDVQQLLREQLYRRGAAEVLTEANISLDGVEEVWKSAWKEGSP